jgi:gliding motility-associated-like protein
VPTAFTPNGDGRNDLLGPLCFGIKKLHYFTLYNRWGQIIFSTKEINGRWNGTYKGAAQNTETFVWMVRGESFDGRVISKQGVVTLIR